MQKQQKHFMYALLAILGFTLLCGSLAHLSQDEAYYWVWSRHLALSYFDHPGMIAYLIHLTTLFGSNEFTVRLVSLLCYGGAAICLYQLAKDLKFSRSTAQLAVIVYLTMPLTQWSLIAVSPGAPQTLFWAISLLFYQRFLMDEGFLNLAIAGCSVGLLLLSKYTGLLIFPVLFLLTLCSPQKRLLFSWKPYFALALSLLVASPIFIWNAQHDWASFSYQYHHGMADGHALNFDTWSEFLASQWLAFNPIFSTALVIGCFKFGRRCWQNHTLRYLFIPWVLVIAFFGYEALYRRELTYWPEPAWWSASLLLAYSLDTFNWRKTKRFGLLFSIGLMLCVKGAALIPGTRLNQLASGQALPLPIIEKLNTHPSLLRQTHIVSDSWQNAALIEFYLDTHPHVLVINHAGEPGQFAYWSPDLSKALNTGTLKSLLYIGEQKGAGRLNRLYRACSKLMTHTIKHYYRRMWTTRDFQGWQCIKLQSHSVSNTVLIYRPTKRPISVGEINSLEEGNVSTK